ncbi:MAG TPA: transcription-repair coupling factor [Candidatus Hydrogenedentes bacterium]|nr:transcription-repair coupling factor [Candidatus Hydrogenedentota bacterium]
MSSPFPELNLARRLAQALGLNADAAVAGAWGAARAITAAQVAAARDIPLCYITAGRLEAEAAFEDLVSCFGEDQVVLIPAWEVLPRDRMAPSDDIVAERFHALDRLLRDNPLPRAIVCPARSALQYTPAPNALRRLILRLEKGREIALHELPEQLIDLGYQREVMVEGRGQFSVRGGILDIFPISADLPCRIEFFDDAIESIRIFDPETQRSVREIPGVDILPRSEKDLISGPDNARKPDGLPLSEWFPENALVALEEPDLVEGVARELSEDAANQDFFISWDDFLKSLKKRPILRLCQSSFDFPDASTQFRLSGLALTGFAGNLELFWERLRQWERGGYTVRLFCVNPAEKRRFLELAGEQGFRPGQDTHFDFRVEVGRLSAGFDLPEEKLAALSEKEIFGRHYVRRHRRRFEVGTSIAHFSDLKPGDYVAHEHHGIGRYIGLQRFPNQPGDFLAIQYAGGGKVYVPVTAIDQVQKYQATEGALPKMDRLGGAGWALRKEKVRTAVRQLTEQLIKLYAARESARGHAFSPDTPWQAAFEEAFEYEETSDQLRAIKEVKRDMESPRPMDRLLCGDVGFGKTEVALRAAFKAVMDQKQVAVLCPTTVLAQQHYNTFRERMADFPVRVALLNRFRSPAEQKETIEKLRDGLIDVVIGTHMLLSRRVQFRDLGLLIIDEEQRFGVAQKERLKQLRVNVDTLTMSATPIPRTLHMALIGARDMSVINTAPNDRLPIHTWVGPWDQEVIREALERELVRQGQVFFLHNRVQNIYRVAEFVRKLVPRARVGVGHGQMERHELEAVMTSFVNRELDVLVCTTIIGSGIDIPNANTIIVDRADQFGLSQLYQIRGRVGRYKHRAYAYLLVPRSEIMTEDARKRLQALQEFSSLGSGFHIAMRDLEIRGAGDLLGAEQSGHIASVGYETYRQIIAEVIAEQTGRPTRRAQSPRIDLAMDAFFPETYIPVAQQKIALYRRAADISSIEEAREFRAELRDRFGPIPPPADRLLRVVELRARAMEAGIASITRQDGQLVIRFTTPDLMNTAVQATLSRAWPEAAFSMDNGQATASIEIPRAADLLDLAEQAVTLIARAGHAGDDDPEAW